MNGKSTVDRRLNAYRWPAFIIVLVVYMLAYFHRLAPAVMGPELIADLQMSAVDFGLMGLALMWAYALAQMPLGIMLDRIGVRRGLTFVLVLAAIGSIVFALAETFPLAVCGRVLVGIAIATFFLAGAKMVAAWFSMQEYPAVWGLFVGLGALGGVIATSPLQFMMNWFGWRHSVLLIGAVSALLGVLVYLVVKDRPADVGLPAPGESTGTVAKAGTADQSAAQRTSFKAIICQPKLLLVGLYLVGLNSSGQVMSALWGGVYMADVYGYDKMTISNILTVGALAMVVGGVVAGGLCRRIGNAGVMLAGAVGVLLVWLYMTINVRAMTVLELTMIMSGISCFSTFAVTGGYAIVRDWVAPAQLGTATGVVNGICWFFGAGAFQQIWGFIINHVSHGVKPYPVEAFEIAMIIQVAVIIISVLCAGYFCKLSWMSSHRVNGDR